MKIAYEPHPVSLSRKAELRAAGYKIVDAKFAPAYQAPAPVADEAANDVMSDTPRRGRPRRVRD
jgi:hypothetical protein